MSWLSQATGIHISPKGASLSKPDPLHALGTALSNPLVQGGLGLITGGASIPMLAGAAGGLLKPGGNIGQAAMGGLQGGALGKVGNSGAVAKVLGLGGLGGGTGGVAGAAGGIVDAAKGMIPGLGGGAGGAGGAMSDFQKWQLLLGGAGAAAGAGADFYNQDQQRALEKQKMAEQQREFDENNKLQQSQLAQQGTQYNQSNATGLAKSLDASPLRDHAQYLLGARLGMSPQSFSPQTLTQGGQQGGIDMNAMGQANQAYTPGAGGTQTSQDTLRKILAQMGYLNA